MKKLLRWQSALTLGVVFVLPIVLVVVWSLQAGGGDGEPAARTAAPVPSATAEKAGEILGSEDALRLPVETTPPVEPTPIVKPVTWDEILTPDDDYSTIGQAWRFDFLRFLRYELELRDVPADRHDRALRVMDSVCSLESIAYDTDVVLGYTLGYAADETGACQFHPLTWKQLGYAPQYATDASSVARAVADMIIAGRISEWTTWHLLGRPSVWGD
jgi:hypothetical protein